MNELNALGNSVSGRQLNSFNIESFTYASRSFSPSFDVIQQDIVGMAFKPDGASLFILADGFQSVNAGIYQFTLSTPWDISTASYAGNKFQDFTLQNCSGFTFNSDGTKAFTTDQDSSLVREMSFSTAYDASTASLTGSNLDVSAVVTHAYGASLTSNGLNLFIIDNNRGFERFSLSTAFDVSTGTHESSSGVTAQTTSADDLFVGANGGFILMSTSSPQSIYQYAMPGVDLSNKSYNGLNLDVSAQVSQNPFITLSPDLTRLYVGDSISNSTNTIYQYEAV